MTCFDEGPCYMNCGPAMKIETTRQATHAETAAEMDRRGDVIVSLENDLHASKMRANRLEDALRDIDAVGCDFGYYEAAAKTMKEIASKALLS